MIITRADFKENSWGISSKKLDMIGATQFDSFFRQGISLIISDAQAFRVGTDALVGLSYLNGTNEEL